MPVDREVKRMEEDRIYVGDITTKTKISGMTAEERKKISERIMVHDMMKIFKCAFQIKSLTWS